jgi:EAL domain-containing protein (putative c-di-GMP-specific phosphodiesterase class I)
VAIQEALRPLRQRGLRLAIDDTGAGYASMTHILKLEPDIIKLDCALTTGIDRDPVRRSLAAALTTFAREMGAVVVAEGIETEAELGTLRQLGVMFGQGFGIARPAPLSEFADLSMQMSEIH